MHDLLVYGDANLAGVVPVAKESAFATVMADTLPGVLVYLQRADARPDKGGHLAQHGRGNPAGQAHGRYLMIFF